MLWGVKWYYWLLLVLMCIAAIFVWQKALKASKARRERLKKEAEIWRRDFELRENYRKLSEDIIFSAPTAELLHGVAMNIQIKLENAPNMEKAFNALPLEKKYIYTLEYFDEDAKKSLSTFFKNNGEPLLGLASPALSAVGLFEISDICGEIYPMYDPESDVSIDREKVAFADEKFKQVYDSQALLCAASEYIKQNKEIFLENN